MTYNQEKQKYTKYKQVIQLMQQANNHPLYMTIEDKQQAQTPQYQLCQKLVSLNILTKNVKQENINQFTPTYIAEFSITSQGEQMLGQCKLLNARIKQNWTVSREYIKQQKYCLWMILFPIVLFTITFLCHASVYFSIFSILLMIFIFALAIVNSLHYNASINTSRSYEDQIPKVLQLFE